jgi:C4-dicarboxylate-binding protein DctP
VTGSGFIVLAATLSAVGTVRPATDRHQVQPRRGADTPKGKAAEFFAKKADELTKGKVKVEVYANSTLYKDKEEMEALQLGAVQMLAPSLAKFGPLGVKEFEVFDLPYIFDMTTTTCTR